MAKENAENAFSAVDPNMENSLSHRANKSLSRSAELSRSVEDKLNALVVNEQNTKIQTTLTNIKLLDQWIDGNISQIKGSKFYWQSKISLIFIAGDQQSLEDHQERLKTVYPNVEEELTGLDELSEQIDEFVENVEELKVSFSHSKFHKA